MPQCGLWGGHLLLSDYNPTQRQTENGGCAWTLVCSCWKRCQIGERRVSKGATSEPGGGSGGAAAKIRRNGQIVRTGRAESPLSCLVWRDSTQMTSQGDTGRPRPSAPPSCFPPSSQLCTHSAAESAPPSFQAIPGRERQVGVCFVFPLPLLLSLSRSSLSLSLSLCFSHTDPRSPPVFWGFGEARSQPALLSQLAVSRKRGRPGGCFGGVILLSSV